MDETVVVRNLHVETSPNKVEAALFHAGLDELAEKSSNTGTVHLQELSDIGLLSVRADPQKVALAKATESVLDLALPGPLSSFQHNNNCLRWLSPDEWLLSCPIEFAFSNEMALRSAISGHCAIVNVSAGYAVLVLSGEQVSAVLRKSTSYDVHPRNFPPGKVVGTTFAKTHATIRCVEINRYELIIRRSFADYVWLWIQNAAREYGLFSCPDYR